MESLELEEINPRQVLWYLYRSRGSNIVFAESVRSAELDHQARCAPDVRLQCASSAPGARLECAWRAPGLNQARFWLGSAFHAHRLHCAHAARVSRFWCDQISLTELRWHFSLIIAVLWWWVIPMTHWALIMMIYFNNVVPDWIVV